MRPRVGVSACLLGQAVRHDGAHKRSAFVVEVLGARVDFVPVCPEVELGLGVPREPIRLEEPPPGAPGEPELRGLTSGRDLSAAMNAFAQARVEGLRALGLQGYVLKSRSPSCGLAGVPVAGGTRTAAGAFARVLRARCPELVVVEESDLSDARACDSFLASLSPPA